MPSQGSAGFLSGFTRGLFPGLNRGAEHIAGGWRAEDEFERSAEMARREQKARQLLAAQKRKDAFDLKDRDIAGKKEVQTQRDTAAAGRLDKRIAGDKEVAGIYSKAGIDKTGMNIAADERAQSKADAQASLQRRRRLAQQAIEAAKSELGGGPLSPQDIDAIKNEFFGDMTAAERRLLQSEEFSWEAEPKGRSGFTYEERKKLNDDQFRQRKELAAGQAGIKLLGDPTIKYTDRATYDKAKAAADRLLGDPGAAMTADEVRAAGKAFEAANGRPPKNKQELEAFLGKGQ